MTGNHDLDPASAQFLQYAQTGDRAALEAALEICLDGAYAQAGRALGSGTDGEDAVHEALLQLLRQARHYDARIPFAAWFGRLVQIACSRVRRSRARRQRREALAMNQTNASPTAPELEPPLDREALYLALDRLSEGDRQLIELHHLGGISHRDIATALATSESVVAKRLSRARGRLHRHLSRAGIPVTLIAIGPALQALPAATTAASSASGLTYIKALLQAPSLPTTTLPISLAQTGIWFMTTHPAGTMATVTASLLLGIMALVLPSLLHAVEAAPQGDPPDGQAWQGPAAELLKAIPPEAPHAMAVDWDYVREVYADTKPTSMLADPQLAPTLERLRDISHHVAYQPEMRDDYFDWFPYVGIARGMVGTFASFEKPRPTVMPEMKVMLIADLGKSGADSAMREFQRAHARWKESLRRYPARWPTSFAVHGFRGGEMYDWLRKQDGRNPRVLLRNESTIAFGERELLHDTLPQLARATKPVVPGAPIWARSVLTDFVGAYAALQPDGEDLTGLSHWLGSNWTSAKVEITTSVWPEDDAWAGRLLARGLQPAALRQPAAWLRALLPESAMLTAAVGIDPASVVQALEESFVLKDTGALHDIGAVRLKQGAFYREVKQLEHQGLPTDHLFEPAEEDHPVFQVLKRHHFTPAMITTSLTGDLGLIVEDKAPIPDLTMVLGITADCDEFITAIARTLRASPAQAPPGATAAWSATLPIGDAKLIQTPDRLILTTCLDVNRFLVSRSYEGDLTTTIDVTADLPSLAARCLPMLYGMVPDQRVPLCDNKFRWSCNPRIINNVVKNLSSAQAAIDCLATSDRCKARLRSMERWLRDADPNGARHAKDHWALYVRPEGDSLRARSVYRDNGTWTLLEDEVNSRATQVTRAYLQQQLQGWTHIYGSALDDVQELPLRPGYSRADLPPVHTVVAHLQAYRLQLRQDDEGLRLDESGLPMATIASHIVLTYPTLHGFFDPAFIVDKLNGIKRREQIDQLKQEHRQAITELRNAVARIGNRRFSHPSEMVTALNLDPVALASLFGGKVPQPEDLDSLGTWLTPANIDLSPGNPHPPESFVQWVIPLGDDIEINMANHEHGQLFADQVIKVDVTEHACMCQIGHSGPNCDG